MASNNHLNFFINQLHAPIMKNLRLMLSIAFFIASTTIGFSQGTGGDDPDFPDIPLDGGLSILLAAGALYGGKKVRDYRKKGQNQASEDKLS